MKKTKIIIPALGMLLLSTAASVSGTVAWFSMNTSINVDGMQVTTKVSSNLQIASENVEANFSNEDLTLTRSGWLQPASSHTGVNFFYTTDALGNGAAREKAGNDFTAYNESATYDNQTAKKAKYDEAFNNSYNFTHVDNDDNFCYGYIDYSFYLKGAASTENQNISLSYCDIKYDGREAGAGSAAWGAIQTAWSWRVALFAKETTKNTAVADADAIKYAADSTNTQKTILDFAKSKNQNEVRAVKPEASENQLGEGYYSDPSLTTSAATAVPNGSTYYYQSTGAANPTAASDVDARTAVANANANAYVAQNLPQGETKYYRVVVRLWLEGEDVSCTSDTYAQLTNAWKLDIGFKLDGATAGVQNITTGVAIPQN